MREMVRVVPGLLASVAFVLGCAAEDRGTGTAAQAPIEEEEVPAGAPAPVEDPVPVSDGDEDGATGEEPAGEDPAEPALAARCAAHDQCASDVCDRDAAGGRGACVAEARVVYVDDSRAECITGDGTRARPLCEIRAAMELMTADRDTVRVYPGRYFNFGVGGGVVRIFGPGDGSAIAGEEDTSAGVRVSGGARVLIDGLSFGVGVGTGVACTASSLRLVRSTASGDSNGMTATDCTIELDRARVSGGTRSGLTVAGGGSYRITNSYFTGGDLPSVVFSGTATGTFRFNTVTRGGERTPGGLDCGTTARLIQDSIVTGNFAAEGGAQTVGACTHQRVVVGSLDTRTLPGLIRLTPDLDVEGRLLDTAANAACCIDRGARGAGVRHDFYGTPRPQGRSNDIGAHEVCRPATDAPVADAPAP